MLSAKSSPSSQVNIIPATRRHIRNGSRIDSHSPLRVAAYCRVSTEEKSQENSYAAQKSHYTLLIQSKPDWELAGIYADEGKSGTSRKNRIQFNRMLTDAKAGKIDYIITKSISRFARNTADALDCVHELQHLRPPVGIYFERENIDTLNTSSEIFLTFYCSMAQEESRSISENIKWSIQNNFRSGKPQINLDRMLGYDKCMDGSWLINEEQAETVRYIYRRFLQGTSANAIAKELNTAGRLTVNGRNWRSDTVFNILQNEKYAGDLRMQKTYTESFLTHKAVVNNGEYPQYFLKDHHPPIIDRPAWTQVQELLTLKRQRNKKMSASPFYGITCAKCGAQMHRMTYKSAARPHHSSASIRPLCYAVWKCPNSPGKAGTIQPERTCPALTLTEASMQQSFMELLCKIKQDDQINGLSSDFCRSFQHIYDALRPLETQSEFLKHKSDLLNMQIRDLELQYQQLIKQQEIAENSSRITLGQENHLYGYADHEIPPAADAQDKTDFLLHRADSLKKQLEERRQEKEAFLAQYSLPDRMKNDFDAFLHAVRNLPEMSGGKQPFAYYIFQKFILKLHADGDDVFYHTTFGMQLRTTGNSKAAT